MIISANRVQIMPKFIVLETIRQNPEKYRLFLKKRGKSQRLIKDFFEYESKYKKILRQTQLKRAELNKLTKEIKKKPVQVGQLIEKGKSLKQEIKNLEAKLRNSKKKYKDHLLKLPNIISDNVPEGFSEEENMPVRYWGKPKVKTEHVEAFLRETREKEIEVKYQEISWKLINHADMLENILKKGDTKQAGTIAQSRFYYIFDEICYLDFALSSYAIDFMTKQGYSWVIPPYMLRKNVLMGALDFESFKDMIYKIEGMDLYLIGTSEHPLLGLYINRIIEEDELPIKLVGWSPCFRKEAGAHGKDTKGIFRVHQFHKIEQFVFSHPDDNQKYYEELIGNAEELWKGLELPYRVMSMCTGELGDHAFKKYDLEVWFPAQGKYREVVSTSNCLDWQAFRANLNYRDKKSGKMKYPHTLNSTAIPTSRGICAILENYQKEDGRVIVPKILRKYLEPFELAPKEEILPFNT